MGRQRPDKPTAPRRHSVARAAARLLTAGTVLAAGLVIGGTSATADDAVVYCFDRARDVVTVVVAGQCRGDVITREQAEEVRARRASRVLDAMKATRRPIIRDRKRIGLGSGFFVATDGQVITNYHVIRECVVVTLETTTGLEARAAVSAVDPEHDLAVLRVNMVSPAVAAFRRTDEPLPDMLYIIGYPTRTLPPIDPQVTEALLADPEDAVVRSLALPPWFLKLRAFVYPGNSGGPLVDRAGGVRGVVFAQVNSVGVFQKTGDLVCDLGFAIPNRIVLPFLARHGIRYRTTPAIVDPLAEILEIAKPFVVRVSCWK